MNTLTINEVLAKADAGTLTFRDVFYDWFCRDSALVNRTKNLIPKLRVIAKSPLINPETDTVFFKNNCPMVGSLYDSISICRGEDGDVVYWICPKSGHKAFYGRAEVLDLENEREINGTWTDVKNFFRNENKVK